MFAALRSLIVNSKLPLALMGVLSLVSIFVAIIIPQTASRQLHIDGTYWLLLALLVAALIAIQRSINIPALQLLLQQQGSRMSLLLVLLATGYMHSQEAHEFKTLADEPIQVGVSQLMHSERKALLPLEANWVDGAYKVTAAAPDKRPSLYPLLVSFLHDLTGYRVANAFFVNGLLTFVFLGLACLLGYAIQGAWTGRGLVILFAGVPEIVRHACGAGFELLNLTLMLLVMLMALRHLEAPDKRRQDALCLSLILLAYARYESVLFVASGALVLLFWWFRERKVILSPGLLASPPLMIGYLIQHRVFWDVPDHWQMFDQGERVSPFSLSYLPEQIQNLQTYFFSPGGTFPNSWPLALLGFFAIGICVTVFLLKVRQGRQLDPAELTISCFLVSFGGLLLLMLTYGWELDNHLITRLNLPFYLPLALCLALLCRYLSQLRARSWTFAALAAVITIGYGMPKIAKHTYSNTYTVANTFQHIATFERHMDGQQYYITTRMPGAWLAHQIPSVRVLDLPTRDISKNTYRMFQEALRRATGTEPTRQMIQRAMVKYYLEQPGTPPLFLYEIIYYNPYNKEGLLFDIQGSQGSLTSLDASFVRETVIEAFDAGLHGYRISRIVDVEGVPSLQLPLLRRGDFDNLIQQLP